MQDGTGPTSDYITGVSGAMPPFPQGGPAPAATACLRHCFEFRLCGSESKQQAIALVGFERTPLVVAIERVRAFLTGDGPSAAAASAIGGIEVYAELVSGSVQCTAQLSDFQPGDLVVVQVDLVVYTVTGAR